jgi:hypothetical protein
VERGLLVTRTKALIALVPMIGWVLRVIISNLVTFAGNTYDQS